MQRQEQMGEYGENGFDASSKRSFHEESGGHYPQSRFSRSLAKRPAIRHANAELFCESRGKRVTCLAPS